MTSAAWHGLETASVERLEWTRGDGIGVHSTVDDGGARYEYDVTLDDGWVFLRLEVRAGDGRRLTLERDADGRWRADGEERPDLDAAVDIDLTFSPFTNTLPIRRLQLPVGAAADIVTAWVDAPSLTVTPDPQRYTRTGDRRYRYDSLDSDFSREITIDADGFVIDYPGLFRRVP